MLNHTTEKENHTPANRSGMSSGIKRLAIAGVCLCIITAGVTVAHAAGVLKPVSKVFQEIFHLEKETAKITDEVGSCLNISDTDNDVSVTADAVLGDNYNFAVVFSIQKKDGTAFEKADMLALTSEKNTLNFRSMNIRNDKRIGNQRGYYHFYDVNPDDSSFQLLYTCATDTNDSIGTQVTASFTDFGYYKPSNEFVPVASGSWNISFPLNYTDSARHFDTKQKIEQDGKTITVKKAEISPVGFHIDFEIKSKKNKKTLDLNEVGSLIKHVPLRLILTDGKKINLNKKSKGFSVLDEDNGSAHAAYGNTFQEIIPIEQMKSLCIGNLTLDF